jgi:hypothetical protein
MTAPILPTQLDGNSQVYFEQVLVKIIVQQLFMHIPDKRTFDTQVKIARGLINALFSKEAGIATESVLRHYYDAFVVDTFEHTYVKIKHGSDVTVCKTFADLDILIAEYQEHLTTPSLKYQ